MVLVSEVTNPGLLRPKELEAVYAISQVITRAKDSETALNEIIQLARPVFIFDNVALFEWRENGFLEPTFARAIGRGRFREADLTWGESCAQTALKTAKTVLRIEDQLAEPFEDPEDRTGSRYSLALPLVLGGETRGALVFVRFGGPDYSPDQVHLAEYIAALVAQLLEHRQLVERIANLEAKRRLDTLQDDFIAMMSHELLTPLGFIKGYATTLLREDITWNEETRREFLQIIDEESDRLRELIDHMLDSSRLQAGTLKMSFQPTRIDTLLRDAILRARTGHENLTINLELLKPGLQVRADPVRLAQVFENLLSNAAKYAPGQPVLITVSQVGDMVCIIVADRGPGIAPEHLEHIFKRFYRVPGLTTSTRGIGLGLYICRKIIEAHEGNISLHSVVGQGTIFTILLPAHNPHPPPADSV